ncbi:hypothetical protein FF38_13880 [Lucilia cuprina]|uniref:Uncharacterized protein n=1 Tax=Lucilia cuprina TaxID=7375 RepID=A0A0L0CIF1_LUCCU|nr:hypothetical protein FF38_13880 [Lucilia cuprina]
MNEWKGKVLPFLNHFILRMNCKVSPNAFAKWSSTDAKTSALALPALVDFQFEVIGEDVVEVGEAGGVGLWDLTFCNPGSVFIRIIAGKLGEGFETGTFIAGGVRRVLPNLTPGIGAGECGEVSGVIAINDEDFCKLIACCCFGCPHGLTTNGKGGEFGLVDILIWVAMAAGDKGKDDAPDDDGNVGDGLLTWALGGCGFWGWGDGVFVDWLAGDLFENNAW